MECKALFFDIYIGIKYYQSSIYRYLRMPKSVEV